MMGTASRFTVNRSGFGSWSLLALTLCLAPATFPVPGPVRAQDGPGGATADLESLLNQGFAAFERGDNDAAGGLFEKAFAQNPTNDALYDFVQDLTYPKVYAMMRDSDPRVAGYGRQLVQGARLYQRKMLEDTEAVRQAVAEVFDSEAEEQIQLLIKHSHTYGRNLVPELVPILGENDISRQTLAFRWIYRIGLAALPPLVVAWKHPEHRIRMNVARLLGVRALRHPFALAYLKAQMETDAHQYVREAARESLEVILSDLNQAAEPKEAKVYFLSNARQLYVNPYRNPFTSPMYSPTVYTLVGDRVVGEKVVEFQLSERMAMQALEEARALDPSYKPVHVMDVMNDAAQVVEYDENKAWYARQDGYEELKDILARQGNYVDYVLRLRVLAAQPETLYLALEQASLDQRADVAHYLIRRILEKQDRGPVPASLVRGLEDENSRLVRIAAAVTLAYWNPTGDFDAGEQVISVLSDAVVQSGVRTIVRGMGNQDLANRFGSLLRNLGMESLVHEKDAEVTFVKVAQSPPDALLLDTEIRQTAGRREIGSINFLVNELRKNYRTQNVPVLIAVDPAGLDKAKERYESEERKIRVIPQNLDALGLRRALDPLFADREDSKTLATRLAAEAAEALAYVASVHTEIPVERSVDALLRVLSSGHDSVRIPCIRALGDLKATGAVGELAQVFENATNAVEVREAAMLSVGKILAVMEGEAPQSVLSIILPGTREGNLTLRRAAWIAFSNAGASPEEYQKLVLSPAPAGAGSVEEPSGEESSEPEGGEETDEDLELDLDADADDGS